MRGGGRRKGGCKEAGGAIHERGRAGGGRKGRGRGTGGGGIREEVRWGRGRGPVTAGRRE